VRRTAEQRVLGVHVSIAGGVALSLERTRELGCNAMQIFSHNPRGWFVKPLGDGEAAEFRRLREKYEIHAVIHTSYLINLAAKTAGLLEKSIALMKAEMDRADALGIGHVILHTGSASGVDSHVARNTALGALRVLARLGSWNCRILFENTAGERGDITSKMADLGFLLRETGPELAGGVCIDTCHAFSAGYDISKADGIERLIGEIEEHTGIDSVKCVHLNDARNAAGSGVDRHEHIGMGRIGDEGIGLFVNHPKLRRLPFILETPKKTEDDDPTNLARVRKMFMP
jgi:deoxyribonuclease-4